MGKTRDRIHAGVGIEGWERRTARCHVLDAYYEAMTGENVDKWKPGLHGRPPSAALLGGKIADDLQALHDILDRLSIAQAGNLENILDRIAAAAEKRGAADATVRLVTEGDLAEGAAFNRKNANLKEADA